MREHKRPKFDVSSRNGKERQPEQGSSGVRTTTSYTMSQTTGGTTTAYTLPAKDSLNLKIVTKDPSSIIDEECAFMNKAKAARKPKVDTNSQAYKKALSSAGPGLRSDTRDKPINTYPEMHHKAREY